MPKRGILRISIEEVAIPPPITQNFERHLLLKQSKGKQMLSFVHIEGGVFRIYYGEVGEGEMGTTTQLENVDVAPWRLYVFSNLLKLEASRGELFCSIRLVDEYADLLIIGDPVEMVDVSSLQVLGSAEVVGLHRFRLGALTPEIIQIVCNRVKNADEIRELLECKYEQSVNINDIITVIYMRATSPVNLSVQHEDWGVE